MGITMKHRIRLAVMVAAAFGGGLAAGRVAAAASPQVDRILAACDGAATLTAGSPVSADVSSGSDVDVFVFTLAGTSNDVALRVTDPTDELHAQVFGNCDLTRGPGSGDPIDGSWDGNQQVLAFSAGSGVYYVTVRAQPGSHSYPLDYAISLGVNE